jgi:hypothetical protein
MSENMADDFIDKKHDRLLRFASTANIFAWVVFGVYILAIFGKFSQIDHDLKYGSYLSEAFLDWGRLFSQDPLYTISLLVNVLQIFLQGVIWLLVLKGVSMGLNMLVETDLNYRESTREESHE